MFANILENAVKYTREGGAIQIGLKQYEMYAEIRIRIQESESERRDDADFSKILPE